MILVLGSDGYIGHAYIDGSRHETAGIDNTYKRTLLQNLNIEPLYNTRIAMDDFIDCAQYGELSFYIRMVKPHTIIHLAENPSAPYSMSGREEAFGLVDNNLFSTLNLIYAVRDYAPDCHIIKLGTMGEYGTPNVQIPEGWFDLEYKGRKDRMLFPKTPHSMYHLSKVFESDALAFACRMWNLRVTDLQQGFVHSINNYDNPSRFCYDGMFGTVLNRFMIQALIGHPLTVYGKGGQTRGVLHLKDTIQCLDLAVENPANKGEYRVINQLTEWKSVNDYAVLVKQAAKKLGWFVDIESIPNPRIEKEDHFYDVEHTRLTEYGLKPTLLDVDLICETMEFLMKYKDNIREDQILPKVAWRC